MISIEFNKSSIKKIVCDCPNASSGNKCNMAAVLFK